MPKKFLRRSHDRYSKLGRRRKKKQVWRNPTGRDNKMREKRKGYPAVVSVGYKKKKEVRGTIQNKKPLKIYNLEDLGKAGKENILVLGKIGKKRKIEILKSAKEKGLAVRVSNVKKFLKKNAKENKK